MARAGGCGWGGVRGSYPRGLGVCLSGQQIVPGFLILITMCVIMNIISLINKLLW